MRKRTAAGTAPTSNLLAWMVNAYAFYALLYSVGKAPLLVANATGAGIVSTLKYVMWTANTLFSMLLVTRWQTPRVQILSLRVSNFAGGIADYFLFGFIVEANATGAGTISTNKLLL